MVWLFFLGALALQFGAYALWRHFRRALDRVQLQSDMRGTRTIGRASHFIGGHDRIGE
jgi:hypothetical protein